MRIAILGRTQWLYDTAVLLHKSGLNIVLIGTCQAAPEYTVTEDDFYALANQWRVPYFCTSSFTSQQGREAVNLITQCKPDIAISVNWLTILNAEIISLFPQGVLNAHAGDLPRYRGNACPNWALLSGEKRIGVSVHFMEAGEVDSGDVLLKRYFPIAQDTRIGDIYQWLKETIPDMFLTVARELTAGTADRQKQSSNYEDILRCYPRNPADGYIDWQQPAEALKRLVNASSEPFSGAYTYYRGKKMIIWRADKDDYPYPSLAVPGQVVLRNKENGEVHIATGCGVLILREISWEGQGKIMPAQVINSTRDRLGLHMPDEIMDLKYRVEKLEGLIKK